MEGYNLLEDEVVLFKGEIVLSGAKANLMLTNHNFVVEKTVDEAKSKTIPQEGTSPFNEYMFPSVDIPKLILYFNSSDSSFSVILHLQFVPTVDGWFILALLSYPR